MDVTGEAPETCVTNTKARHSNLFGLSDTVYGYVLVISSALCTCLQNTMYQATEEMGISSNCLLFASSASVILLSVCVDLYYHVIGYPKGDHWFVMNDIWKEKQWNKLFSIKGFLLSFVTANSCQFLCLYSQLLSFLFVTDVGDAVAIYDCYPIIVPLFGLCIKEINDWKHRYFVCLVLIVISIVLISQPGFIFGYINNINETKQAFGCLLSIIAATANAFSIAATIVQKKVSFRDFRNQMRLQCIENPAKNAIENVASTSDSNIVVASSSAAWTGEADEETPLIKNHPIPGAANESELEMDVTPQSNEYIIQNDIALTVLNMEYMGVMLATLSLLFSLFSLVKGEISNDFQIFYNFNQLNAQKIAYIICTSILWWLNLWFMTLGLFKMKHGSLASILHTIDVCFTYVMSYVLLSEVPDLWGGIGASLIIATVVISVYPWHRHQNISKSF